MISVTDRTFQPCNYGFFLFILIELRIGNAIHQGFFKKNMISYVNFFIISATAVDVSSSALIKDCILYP